MAVRLSDCSIIKYLRLRQVFSANILQLGNGHVCNAARFLWGSGTLSWGCLGRRNCKVSHLGHHEDGLTLNETKSDHSLVNGL
jgi:hypothetical protein